MSSKPKLHYVNGRGLMESIRWLLAAAGVEFEEEFITSRAQLLQLIQDGVLLFEQVPMVEMDGMKMVQSRAILAYIAGKYDLYGKDLKERALIDVYVEGARDLMLLFLKIPYMSPEKKEADLRVISDKATNRYLPAFEKVLSQHGGEYLVGKQLSWADVQVLEVFLMLEEKFPSILSSFPLLQAFKARISDVPTIKKFLQPGSQRKPPSDENYAQNAREVFSL